ncbi:unnamed protein product [Penicillium discolor]
MAMRKIEKCVGSNHEIHVPEGTELIELTVILGHDKQIKQIEVNCLAPATKSQKSARSSRTHHHSNTNSILRRSQGLSPLIGVMARLVF